MNAHSFLSLHILDKVLCTIIEGIAIILIDKVPREWAFKT